MKPVDVPYLLKFIGVADKQLALAKRTLVAFGVAYEAQRHGHTDKWAKAIKLYQKCDDVEVVKVNRVTVLCYAPRFRANVLLRKADLIWRVVRQVVREAI